MATLVIPTDASAVVGPPQGQWTRADWEALPDDGRRYEIIDGSLYMSTAPSSFHQWICQRLYRHLGIPAEDRGLAYTFLAPVGVFMPNCDPVQPDFVVVRLEHRDIIHDRRIFGVPDLIIEVLSPGSADYDEKVKLFAYARAGVPEYGIVDPARRELRLHPLEAPGRYRWPETFGAAATARFAALPGLELPVSRLFDGAPDTTL